MQTAKLILLLREMSTRERTRFREYVHSPFFNKHKKLRELCDYLLRYAPQFSSPKLDKQKVFAALFIGQTYEESLLYNLSSDLLDLLNQFFAQQQYQQDQLQQKTYALRALQERGADKQWKSTSRQHRILQKKYAHQDAHLFYQQYLFEHEQDVQLLNQPKRQYNEHFQEKNNRLDLFFLASKLRLACDTLNRNAIIEENYECWAAEELMELVAQNMARFEAFPIIKIYYQIFRLFQHSKEADYQKLKELLATNIDAFSLKELQLMYDYATNYVIRNINSGGLEYYQEFFDLHRFLLEKGILIDAGHLSAWDYKNIATVGLRLKEYEWVEQFIWAYKDKVREADRENVFSFNLASLYYARGQYKKALQLLHQVDFTDVSYYVGAKIIQLKSYYELDELDSGLSLINSFRTFLGRSKKLSEYRKKANLNMLKLAQKIILLCQQRNFMRKTTFQKSVAKIQLEAKELQPFTNRDWVEEILDGMLERKNTK